MQIEPYLFFNGRCEEAIEFYRSSLGAEIPVLMRYSDSPDPDACPSGADDKIMHANVQIGNSTIMVSDGDNSGEASFEGVSLSIAVDNVEEAERYFTALSEGGEIQMPLEKTFWSPAFGMVKDRFGVSWMVNVFSEEEMG